MVPSFYIMHYYLFDLDNFVIKLIKSNNAIEDDYKAKIIHRLNDYF